MKTKNLMLFIFLACAAAVSGCAHVASFGDAPLVCNNIYGTEYEAERQAEKIAGIDGWIVIKSKKHHMKMPALPPVNLFFEEMPVPGAFPFVNKLEIQIITDKSASKKGSGKTLIDQTIVVPSWHPRFCEWNSLGPCDKIRIDFLKEPRRDKLNAASYLVPVLIGREE